MLTTTYYADEPTNSVIFVNIVISINFITDMLKII